MNRKVKNATQKTYNGIKFKSLSEIIVYKTLSSEGFDPKYEEKTFVIWDGFIPHIPFYTKNDFKRKNHNIEVISEKLVRDNRPLSSITYTPDFIFNYNDKTIIVEVKGFENDVYPYKMKLFRRMLELEGNDSNYEIWEIFSKSQLLNCIELLKSDNNE